MNQEKKNRKTEMGTIFIPEIDMFNNDIDKGFLEKRRLEPNMTLKQR